MRWGLSFQNEWKFQEVRFTWSMDKKNIQTYCLQRPQNFEPECKSEIRIISNECWKNWIKQLLVVCIIQALLRIFSTFFFILFLSHTKICIFTLVTERRFLNIFDETKSYRGKKKVMKWQMPELLCKDIFPSKPSWI